MSNAEYPPPPPGQQPPPQGWGAPPPQQPKKGKAGKIVGLGCLGIVGLVVVISVIAALASSSSGSKSNTPSASSPAKASASSSATKETKAAAPAGAAGDVKITTCEVDPTLKWPSAKLTITNRSSKTSNYMIQVEFVDTSGTRIGEGIAATNNLAPGQVAKETAQGSADASGKVTCKVTDVTRYAS